LTWRYTAHDGNVPMAEMTNGAMTRCFARGAGIAEGTGDVIGEIIGTEESNAHPLFYFANHRSDTMAAYVQHDTTKTLAAEYRYDAFGNLISSTTNEPAFLPRFTFSTKEYLAEAQLYLYAYRVYDPVAGRWTQRDPIDYEDSSNLYQFCGNNPVNRAEVMGLAEVNTNNAGAALPVYEAFLRTAAGKSFQNSIRTNKVPVTVKSTTGLTHTEPGAKAIPAKPPMKPGTPNKIEFTNVTIYINPTQTQTYKAVDGSTNNNATPAAQTAHEAGHTKAKAEHPVVEDTPQGRAQARVQSDNAAWDSENAYHKEMQENERAK
jgi:RHS repeat-associated protein